MSQYPYPRDSLEKIQARLLVMYPDSERINRGGVQTINRFDPGRELSQDEAISVTMCILEALGMELQRGPHGLEFVKA